jgi:hypothetical protein
MQCCYWDKCISWSGIHVEKHSLPLHFDILSSYVDVITTNENTSSNTRFEVLTAAWLRIQVFWQVTQCYMVHGSQCFEGPWWLYIQGFSSTRIPLLSLLSVMQRHKSVFQIIVKISNSMIIEYSSKILAIFSHVQSSCSG